MRRFIGPDVLSNVYIQPRASPNILSAHFFKRALFFSAHFFKRALFFRDMKCADRIEVFWRMKGTTGPSVFSILFLGAMYFGPMGIVYFWRQSIVYFGPHENCIFSAPNYGVFLPPWKLYTFGAKVWCILAPMRIVYFWRQRIVYFQGWPAKITWDWRREAIGRDPVLSFDFDSSLSTSLSTSLSISLSTSLSTLGLGEKSKIKIKTCTLGF